MDLVSESLKAGEASTVHRFERAGLGKAPFRFVEMTEKVYQACPGAPAQPGSNCDYCMASIRYEFWCESSDGKVFKVGCDCIHKIGDRGLVKQISAAERQLRDKKNAAARERKKAKKIARLESARAKLPTIRGTLASQPHPHEYHASQGKTLLDYVEWCLVNHGEERACDVIERN